MTPNPEQSQAGGNEPPVDFEQLLAAASDDPQVLQELVTLYFDQAKEVMAQLGDAVQRRAAPDVGSYAHKLVGASLACGITAMVGPLREMEIRARKGDLADADALMGKAAANLEIVRAVIEAYIVKQKSG